MKMIKHNKNLIKNRNIDNLHLTLYRDKIYLNVGKKKDYWITYRQYMFIDGDEITIESYTKERTNIWK